MIRYIGDHEERALARLASQFRGKPRIEALIREEGRQAQAVEDALWDLLTRRVWEGEGVQLDNLGRLVGQPREAFTDELYRPLLRARIRINRSTGTIPDSVAVLRLVYGGRVIVRPRYPAGLEVALEGVAVAPEQTEPGTPPLASLYARLLQETRKGGVRATLAYHPAPLDDTFTLAPEGDPPGPGPVLATTLATAVSDPYENRLEAVGPIDDWPVRGCLLVGAGGPQSEVVTYQPAQAAAEPPWFELNPGNGLRHLYPAGARVELYQPPAPLAFALLDFGVGSTGIDFLAAGEYGAGDLTWAGFAPSGQIVINRGEPDEEIASYSGFFDDGLTEQMALVGMLTKDHPRWATIEQYPVPPPVPAPGGRWFDERLGCADAAQTFGGRLAGVVEA